MRRRAFLGAITAPLACGLEAFALPCSSRDRHITFSLDEITIGELTSGLARGTWSARQLTEAYLSHIQEIDQRGPSLRAVIELNPEALETADRLDQLRKNGKSVGVLHGIPILIKDNIEVAGQMSTTAGSVALDGWQSPTDAFVAAGLRAAGAVILGKTNLSEWANFRSSHSVSGWSGRGGQTKNPYSLDRNPSGSSSGSAVAVAANLCAVAIGTETDGSVVSPASINGIVGIKPTVGLVSRSGIIPISHSQDTAGPMARTVRDAAILLGVMAGADSADPATTHAQVRSDYTKFLDPGGLRSARLGIARKFVANNSDLNHFLDNCVDVLRKNGAEVVDPADLPSHGKWGDPEFEVLLYEFKTDLNAYLAKLPSDARVHSLANLIEFNETNHTRELALFGQETFVQAEAKGPLTEAKYQEARKTCLRLSRQEGIDAILAEHKLDAIVALTSGPACLTDPINGDQDTGGCSTPAAVAGYPHITVPAGLFRGLPIGLSFFGAAWTEPVLIRLAYAFEQAIHGRQKPSFLETLS